MAALLNGSIKQVLDCVTTDILGLIVGYSRFHQDIGYSDKVWNINFDSQAEQRDSNGSETNNSVEEINTELHWLYLLKLSIKRLLMLLFSLPSNQPAKEPKTAHWVICQWFSYYEYTPSIFDPKCNTKIFLHNLKGEHWIVNSVTKTKIHTSHSLCGGWTDFVCGNSIKVGDVCILKLIQECEFRVRIITKVRKDWLAPAYEEALNADLPTIPLNTTQHMGGIKKVIHVAFTHLALSVGDITSGNGDSFYVCKNVGDDRRLLYTGSCAEILNMKNSQELKKEFLWAEVSLVELKLVPMHKSLINVEILQLFFNMVVVNLMMHAVNSMTWDPGGWSLVH
ncbi:putative transcription factor B3-Domain family [Medicago truncatula]|uniref:Putative transcription factor B3-Domain family n=1 Tax=Medicago truncatula TaxID=3880 RepID=A0A396HCJ1_MEDTR|nr:putative transcription factor B3-Domain family [Medicago truncatula]